MLDDDFTAYIDAAADLKWLREKLEQNAPEFLSVTDIDSDEAYTYVTMGTSSITIGGLTKDLMVKLRRAIGGKWDKYVSDYNLTLINRHSAPHCTTIELTIPRNEACTPRVIGTEKVEVRDYDNVPYKTVEREIVEWDCDPILA